MDTRTPYYLLLADLKKSSRLSPRESQAAMARLLPELEWQNQRAARDLVYPLEVNYGDEFAGLFSKPHLIHRIVSEIRDMLRPFAAFRFVVAYGRIGYADGSIREMGGPVFEMAAMELNRLKKTRGYGAWFISEGATNLALTAMTNAAATFVANMTDYQHAVFLLQKAGLSGNEIAEKLAKDPRSVSNAKQTGHAKTVLEIEAAIDEMLKSIG